MRDKDDSPYIAFALSSGQPIWPNDSGMKEQLLAEVFTTKELVKLLPL
ncbi:hypothetical protein HYU17_03535 [Candidatus Woesearchaeota archaeon]|nr:hypothetical protein [Candidatus Woesearchaeota archaeon]